MSWWKVLLIAALVLAALARVERLADGTKRIIDAQVERQFEREVARSLGRR